MSQNKREQGIAGAKTEEQFPMYSRPSPMAGYQPPQQTPQSPYRQGFASAPPVVVQAANVRTWDGSVLQCCGDCGGSGWATCLVGAYFPCILYGKLRERAFGQSCFWWGLLFFLLAGLMLLSGEEFTYFTVYMFPPYMKTVALIFLGVALILLGASTRSAIRRRFALPGNDCKDLFLWIFCPACALCQEARTLEKNNVNNGEWYGQTRFLPIITQPPTPQAHTPQAHTPQAHTPPPQLPPQSHGSMYGYHTQYQPPGYQPPGFQPIHTSTAVTSPAPSAPPVTGIPFLEAESRAPQV